MHLFRQYARSSLRRPAGRHVDLHRTRAAWYSVAMRLPGWLALLLCACGAPPEAAAPTPEPSASAPRASVRPAPSPEVTTPTAVQRPPSPEEKPAIPAPTSALATARVAGPHWQVFGSPDNVPIAYSANGKWYAMLTSEGLVVGDSKTWQPLSIMPLNLDKGGQALFHPSSQYVVAVYDFYLEIFQVGVDAGGMTLTVSDPPLPWHETPALNPLAFDRTGRYLAVADSVGAVVFDFGQRKPIARLFPQFSLMPSAIGFSRDQLFLTQPSAAPCRCDDFGGSSSGVATWRVGSPKMSARRLQGDVGVECHLRQGTLVCRGSLWDLRSGRRLVQHRLKPTEVLLYVYRLRSSRRWVGVVNDATRKPEMRLGLFGVGGRHRELGPVATDIPQALSVRPQDDFAVYLEYDFGTSQTRVHAIPIAGGKERVVRLPLKVCLDATRVVPDERCQGAPDRGTHWQRKPEAPGLDGSTPLIQAPPLPPPRRDPSLPPEGPLQLRDRD